MFREAKERKCGMGEIVCAMSAFFVSLYFYFMKVPIVVIFLAFIVRGLIRVVLKKHSLQRFFVRSDMAVAFLAFPFYAVCTLLPGTTTKSMANLTEIMLLGSIWGMILLVRIVLSLCCSTKYYERCAKWGNVFVFLSSVIFVYFFPTLPE